MKAMNTHRNDKATDAVTTKAVDIELDPAFLLLRHEGKTASITPCESRIVAYLMQSARRPVPAEELRLHALRSCPIHHTTAVEKHICSIRRKIAAIGAATKIKTMRGQGYVLN